MVLVSPPLPANIMPHRAGGICNISSGGGGPHDGCRAEKEDEDSTYGSCSEGQSSASTDVDSEPVVVRRCLV